MARRYSPIAGAPLDRPLSNAPTAGNGHRADDQLLEKLTLETKTRISCLGGERSSHAGGPTAAWVRTPAMDGNPEPNGWLAKALHAV